MTAPTHGERGHAKAGYGGHDQRSQGRAHRAVAKAIQEGKLTRPKKCEKCGEEPGNDIGGKSKIVAHHHKGYENPLDVQWLCQRCNIRLGLMPDPREPPRVIETDIWEGGRYVICGGPRRTNKNLWWYGQPGYESGTAEIDAAIAEEEALNAGATK